MRIVIVKGCTGKSNKKLHLHSEHRRVILLELQESNFFCLLSFLNDPESEKYVSWLFKRLFGSNKPARLKYQRFFQLFYRIGIFLKICPNPPRLFLCIELDLNRWLSKFLHLTFVNRSTIDLRRHEIPREKSWLAKNSFPWPSDLRHLCCTDFPSLWYFHHLLGHPSWSLIGRYFPKVDHAVVVPGRFQKSPWMYKELRMRATASLTSPRHQDHRRNQRLLSKF